MKASTIDQPSISTVPENSSPLPDAISGIVTEDFIKSHIYTIRGVQVMLDCDLAKLFGVETKALNQAVKRNFARFPERFMFQMCEQEAADSRSQIVTSSWGGRRYRPFAFTEQGVIMLASVLRSDTAIAVSLRVVEAFVAMRKALASIAPLLTRIDAVERRQITDQTRNEERFDTIFKAIARKLVRKAFSSFHDHFLSLDGTDLCLCGASLKDLDRKYCTVTRMDFIFIPSILQRL